MRQRFDCGHARDSPGDHPGDRAGNRARIAPVRQAKEDEMIEALLTPVILGLTVAMIIRLMAPRRA